MANRYEVLGVVEGDVGEDTSPPTDSYLDAALWYARRGVSIVPLYPLDAGGGCGCGSVGCRAAGKHPMTPHAHQDASRDESIIRRWWSQNPQAGIGIAVEPSGLVVVDFDSEEALNAYLATGEMTDTFAVESRAGHRHYYYQRRGDLPTRGRVYRGQYDILARGLVVAAPSKHVGATRYTVVSPFPWNRVSDLPFPPEWVCTELEQSRSKRDASLRLVSSDDDEIDGQEVYRRVEGQLRANLRHLITEGPERLGVSDRSGADAKVIAALVGEGLTDDEIVALYQHYPIGTESKYAERGEDYLANTIANIRGFKSKPSPEVSDSRQSEPLVPDAVIDNSTTTELWSSPAPGSKPKVTEQRVAGYMIATRGEDLRLIKHPKIWVVWDGLRWKEDIAGTAVRRVAIESLRSAQSRIAASDLDYEDRSRVMRETTGMETSARVRGIVDLAETFSGVAMELNDFDAEPWLLNVQNGTVHLRNGELREQRRQDYLTQVTAVAYNPHAEAPEWHAFLQRIFDGDVDLISYVQRAVGYSLTGDTSERAIFIAVGGGRNGKSVFLEVLKAVLGDLMAPVDPEVLLQQRNSQHPTSLAMLRGKRFVYAQEPAEGRRLAVSLVKQLTGGDTIVARRMREDPWEFKPTFKLWMSTNSKPIISEHGTAIWDRIKIIPFNVTIPKEEEIRREELLHRFAIQEGPGVLRWAVEGCSRYLRDKLREPKAVAIAVQDYREEMDVLGQFLRDSYDVDQTNPNFVATKTELYSDFREWCETNGETPWDAMVFGRKLTERGFKATTKRMPPKNEPTAVRVGLKPKGQDAEDDTTYEAPF